MILPRQPQIAEVRGLPSSTAGLVWRLRAHLLGVPNFKLQLSGTALQCSFDKLFLGLLGSHDWSVLCCYSRVPMTATSWISSAMLSQHSSLAGRRSALENYGRAASAARSDHIHRIERTVDIYDASLRRSKHRVHRLKLSIHPHIQPWR